ncbi:MAG: hypothetical protein ACYCOR_03000 [Acidobacteriaceae bacterium]
METIRAIAPQRLIFLDESRVAVGMTPRYARSLGGAASRKPRRRIDEKILTMLSALSAAECWP